VIPRGGRRCAGWGQHRRWLGQQRPAVCALGQLVEPEAKADDVHRGHGAQPVDVACERATQADELRPFQARQTAVRSGERSERGRCVAADLQFLRRQRDQALDVDQDRVIAAAGEIEIELIQRTALPCSAAAAVSCWYSGAMADTSLQ
jgi:hypothetical protein